MLCYFVMCHFMGIVIFSTDFHLFVECVGVFRIAVMFLSHWWVLSHCGYVLRPIVIILSLWIYSKRCMCEFFRLWFIPNVVWCMSMYKHENPPHGLSLVNGWVITYHRYVWCYGGMYCRHCVLFACLHYYYTKWWWKIQ